MARTLTACSCSAALCCALEDAESWAASAACCGGLLLLGASSPVALPCCDSADVCNFS